MFPVLFIRHILKPSHFVLIKVFVSRQESERSICMLRISICLDDTTIFQLDVETGFFSHFITYMQRLNVMNCFTLTL